MKALVNDMTSSNNKDLLAKKLTFIGGFTLLLAKKFGFLSFP